MKRSLILRSTLALVVALVAVAGVGSRAQAAQFDAFPDVTGRWLGSFQGEEGAAIVEWNIAAQRQGHFMGTMTYWPDLAPQPHMFFIEGQVTPSGDMTFVGFLPYIEQKREAANPGAQLVARGIIAILREQLTFDGILHFTGPGGTEGSIFMIQEVSEVPAPER